MTPTSTEVQPRRRTLLDISQEIIALHEGRQDAEDDGDAARVAAIDQELQVYLKAELSHKVDSVRNFIREQENAAEFYAEEARELLHKAKRSRETVERVKGFVLGIMQALNIPKYHGVTHWIRKQANGGIKPLEIAQPELVPAPFQRATVTMSVPLLRRILKDLTEVDCREVYKTTTELDPGAIRAALERGEGVPGCRLQERGEQLRMD